MTEPTEPPLREVDRRKLNVMEGVILAAIIGMATMIFSMRDAVIRLQASQEATKALLIGLQSQLADIPTINQRISRAEVKVEALEEGQKELRQTRGLK